MSKVANELSERINIIARFTKYRIHKDFYIGDSDRVIFCVRNKIICCTAFFMNVRNSTTRPEKALSSIMILEIFQKKILKTSMNLNYILESQFGKELTFDALLSHRIL